MSNLDELDFDSESACPNCGQHVDGDSVCPNCGAVLGNEDELDSFQEDEEL